MSKLLLGGDILDVNRLLHLATYAGMIMLQSGAEIYRVEETICRICQSYEIDEANSFVTPTGIMVSISYNKHTYSLVKRVHIRGVNLHKIEKVNDLSRRIATFHPSFDSINKELNNIDKMPRYSLAVTLLCAGCAAGFFAILFGGTFRDLIAAFFIGGFIKYLFDLFGKMSINDFFINCICAGTSAAFSILFLNLGFITNIDETIIGAIMILVPGLAITNAIRDTIAGDYLAGITKASEAFMVAIAIAVGTGGVISFWLKVLGGI